MTIIIVEAPLAADPVANLFRVQGLEGRMTLNFLSNNVHCH